MITLLDFVMEASMTRAIGALSFLMLLIIGLAAPLAIAAECDYGIVNASVRTTEGIWKPATMHPVLRRNESFDIQITIIAKTALQVVFLKLHEFGTPVFEVLTGPAAIGHLLENRGKISAKETFLYSWKVRVRPDTPWVNGYAPLEVFVQFNTNDSDERRITFDVLTAYIVDGPWENQAQDVSLKNNPSHQMPGENQSSLEFSLMIIGVCFLCVCIRLRRRPG